MLLSCSALLLMCSIASTDTCDFRFADQLKDTSSVRQATWKGDDYMICTKADTLRTVPWLPILCAACDTSRGYFGRQLWRQEADLALPASSGGRMTYVMVREWGGTEPRVLVGIVVVGQNPSGIARIPFVYLAALFNRTMIGENDHRVFLDYTVYGFTEDWKLYLRRTLTL